MTLHPSNDADALHLRPVKLRELPEALPPFARWIPLDGKTLLSINRSNGTHWRTYRKNADEWKHAANHDIHQWKNEHPSHQIPTLTHAQIDIWIHKARRGRYDPSNLYPTAKALVDAYIAAGLLPDDDYEHLDGPHLHHGGFSKTAPGLLIVITPLTAQPHPPAHPQH